MTEAITVDRQGHVGLVTIDRPDRRNAIDAAACSQLEQALSDHVDQGCRVVVLTGAGGHFCAGADLEGVTTPEFASALLSLLRSLLNAPVVVVAAVDGAALGAGTQLAVASDLRVATPAARFGIPAAKLGLAVDHWTVGRLARLVGGGPARAMLLAAEPLSGDDAYRLGLVQRLGDLDVALAWAAEIAALAPLTLAAHKLALNHFEVFPDDADVEAARRKAWSSEDVAEGMAAFRQRRSPEFRGR